MHLLQQHAATYKLMFTEILAFWHAEPFPELVAIFLKLDSQHPKKDRAVGFPKFQYL
jgi:hypothetical protein